MLRAHSTEAFAAENSPAARRLEWHAVLFAAFIAGYLVTLAFAAPSASAAEVRSSRVATCFAATRLAQVFLSVKILLALGEGKGRPALRACYLPIRHNFLP